MWSCFKIFWSALVVDLDLQNPHWCDCEANSAEIVGSRHTSNISARGDSIDIGQKLDPLSAGLPGFNKGMILAIFHMYFLNIILLALHLQINHPTK